MSRYLLRFCLLLPLCLVLACSTPPPQPIDTTVLFFNDVHGHFEAFEEDDPSTGERRTWGGLARLAGLAEQIERENEAAGKSTHLVYGGDLLMGTPMSMVFKGELGMKCFREMGVDAYAIGNHEFDFGYGRFKQLVAEGGEMVPIISCNILDTDGEPLVPGSVTLPIGGDHRLQVIGATTEETPTTTFPANVKGLKFLPPVEAIRQELAQREGEGPAVLVTHLGWKADVEVLKAVPELTAVLGGHDQILLDPPKQVGDRLVLQAAEWAKYLGQIELRYHPDENRTEILSWKYHPITEDLPADPEVAALVAKYKEQLSNKLDEVIAQADVVLSGQRKQVRYEETNLGSLITDIMRESTGAQIALLNGGSIRATINEGPITLADMYEMFPYKNEMILVDIPGSTLMEILKRSFQSERGAEDGGFLQLSGMKVVAEGKKPVEVTIGGEPLAPDATYKAVITDFIKAGGDGYTWLEELPGYPTAIPLRGALIEAFRARGKLAPETEGRITRR